MSKKSRIAALEREVAELRRRLDAVEARPFSQEIVLRPNAETIALPWVVSPSPLELTPPAVFIPSTFLPNGIGDDLTYTITSVSHGKSIGPNDTVS